MADAAGDVTLADLREIGRRRNQGLVGVGLLLVVLVIGLAWAKWLPYVDKTHALLGSRAWSGSPIFASSGAAGSTPSAHGAWSFWTAYAASVWKAALVALVVAALLESLVPRRWLLRVLARRTGLGQGLAAGALALPSMMCTCCTAPVAIGLRRRGAPLGATVAYWLANPLLNPAVIVFLVLTLPARYAAVRIGVGLLLVLGGALLASRSPARSRTEPLPTATPEPLVPWRALPVRFARTLARYLLILVPEYALVVLMTGALSGWLSDFAGLGHAAGPLSLLVVGIVGAVLVIPTGGEIAVIVGLLAAGASAGVAGVLLVTLPAVSLPSIVMVGRTLSWRAVSAVTALTVLGGVLAGTVLIGLS